MEVFAVNIIKQNKSFDFNKLMNFIAKDKQEKVRKFINRENALQMLVADILIRGIVCKKLRIKNNNIVFEINDYGKPFLRGINDFQFNISHSGEWVLCAYDNTPIGIDIEKVVKPFDLNIAKCFFPEEEYRDILEKNKEERDRYFFALWTVKESYFKAKGTGLSELMKSITFKIINNENILMNPRFLSEEIYFRRYYFDMNYEMTICSYHKRFPHFISLVNIDQIVSALI